MLCLVKMVFYCLFSETVETGREELVCQKPRGVSFLHLHLTLSFLATKGKIRLRRLVQFLFAHGLIKGDRLWPPPRIFTEKGQERMTTRAIIVRSDGTGAGGGAPALTPRPRADHAPTPGFCSRREAVRLAR